MLRYSLLLSMLLLALNAGCSGTDLEVTLNGEPVDFDDTYTRFDQSTDFIGLRLVGSSEGDKFVIDDEYSMGVNFQFFRERLLALEPGRPYPIKGTTEFDHEAADNGGTDDSYYSQTFYHHPAAGQADAIDWAYFSMMCFCDRQDNRSQELSGTITFQEIAADHLAGQLSLSVTGYIPFSSTDDQVAEIHADFSTE